MLAEPVGPGRARLVEVLEPSPHRVDPQCPQALDCPGCPLRHVSRAEQSALQREAHLAALKRIAGLELGGPVHTPVGADGWRTRATARLFEGPAGLTLGMRGHPGGQAVDLARCPVQTPEVRALLEETAGALQAAGLRPFDPETRDGEVHYVAASHGQLALGLADPALAEALTLPEATLYVDAVSPARPRVLGAPRLVRGDPRTYFEVEGERFQATFPAWQPQSPASLPTLRRVVLDLLQPSAEDHLLEIGCGTGVLSAALAPLVARLTGVDQERAAVEDAHINVPDARFRVGRAEHALRRLLSGGQRADLVVLHAMRRPYGPQVMRLAHTMGARALLYIAPSVAALARDLAESTGWTAEQVAFVDQLPGTAHLLNLCLLRRSR